VGLEQQEISSQRFAGEIFCDRQKASQLINDCSFLKKS